MATLSELRSFFEEGPSGRKVTTAELRELSKPERDELCELLDAIDQN
jgi:hypothetical protein